MKDTWNKRTPKAHRGLFLTSAKAMHNIATIQVIAPKVAGGFHREFDIVSALTNGTSVIQGAAIVHR